MLKKTLLTLSVVAVTACPKSEEAVAPAVASPPPEETVQEAPAKTFDAVSRADFNLRAAERFEPIFWREDANSNGVLEPEELAVLVGPWNAKRGDFVDGTGFTSRFEALYELLKTPLTPAAPRHQALQLELSQGKPTLVETDSAVFTEGDRKAFPHFVNAAQIIEQLYAKQRGTEGQAATIAPDDTLSRAVFHRNQGAFCVAPKTEKDQGCNAVLPNPSRAVGLYPAAVQEDQAFCGRLEKEKNKDKLMDHFSVVVDNGKGGFDAVPYTQAWKPEMDAVAAELDAAAAALGDDEAAFKTYLAAAAKGFRSNDWEPANEAWVAMGPLNSKWYLRVAPDEVYYEPCAWKAGFALQLARINLASLEWQQKLEPVKADMEKTLADLAGPPYKARKVAFKLPDFIDVVLNAADQRNPHGATIGQSLPNWGKTAEKGGRTVVMTNLYTDVDSRKNLSDQVAALYCKATFDKFTTDPKAALLSVVLHEAAHNLGPSHDYKVKGKTDDVIFGGPLASTMEEMKAQTSALFFTWWLADKGLLTQEEATAATLRDVAWAFGHISRGMYDAAGRTRAYSHLASFQMGHMFKSGVLTWKKDEKAANGADTGCFEVDLDKWKPAVNVLAKRVLQTKGKGDRKDAEDLKMVFVDAKDEWSGLRETIAERWLRAPKATFVYSVRE